MKCESSLKRIASDQEVVMKQRVNHSPKTNLVIAIIPDLKNRVILECAIYPLMYQGNDFLHLFPHRLLNEFGVKVRMPAHTGTR